jgi:hypothetical protein
MEVNKIEKSIDTLFKSLYGDTLLIGSSIKMKYLGLGESIITAGGRTSIVPKFEFISTNKSFTYEYLFDGVYTKFMKVLKYLGTNDKALNVLLSFDLPQVYLTEDDERYLNKSFMDLNKLTFSRARTFGLGGESETVNVGYLDINPLLVTIDFDESNDSAIFFNFSFFVKSGELILRNDEELTLPTDKEMDPMLEEYLKMSLDSKEIDSIVDTLVSRILVKDPFEKVYTYLNPEF